MGSAQYPPGLPATGANGVTVKDTSGSAEIDGNVANSGTNIGVILNNTVALTGSTKIASFQNAGVEKASINNLGTIQTSSTVAGAALTTNGAVSNTGGTLTTVSGASADGASAVGVAVNNTVTLTNATAKILSIRNNGSEKTAFDLNGKQVPASIPTVKAAGAAFCGSAALDTNGTVTIATTAVTATSLILCWMITAGGTVGGIYRASVADITAGTSFIIRSFVSSTAGAVTAATTDTSTVGWLLIG